MLKSIEFPGSNENSATEGVKLKSLEMLLMEKNRTLQTENTQLKLANTEVTGEGVGVEGCFIGHVCYMSHFPHRGFVNIKKPII